MITRYLIITNRKPSPATKKILNKPAGHRKYEHFKKAEFDKILQHTEIISDLDFSAWEIALERFADEYGVLPDEFTRGIGHLIHTLMKQAADGKTEPLRKEDLLAAFCGIEDARKLTASAIRDHTVTEWKEHKGNLGFEPQQMPVQRNLLFEEADNKVKEHALVIFWGSGGCGKSVMAWYFLHSKINAPTVFLPALDIQSRIISRVVAKWSGLAEGERLEEMQRAIKRLKIANPGVRPVFYLGLDGVDENNVVQEYRPYIQEVIRWFWEKERNLSDRAREGLIEPPEATLIITCRDMETITNDILQMTFSPTLRKDNALESILVKVKDYNGPRNSDMGRGMNKIY